MGRFTQIDARRPIRINVRDAVVMVLRGTPKLCRIDFALAPMSWALLEEEMFSWKHPSFELVSRYEDEEDEEVRAGYQFRSHIKWRMADVEIRVFMNARDVSPEPVLSHIAEIEAP